MNRRAVKVKPTTFAEWLDDVMVAEGMNDSLVYRLYVRQGGERSIKSINNWRHGLHVPVVDDAARVVLALEEALPNRDVRESFHDLLTCFRQTPREAGVSSATLPLLLEMEQTG